MDLVLKVLAREGLSAGSEFRKWSSDGPSDVPSQCRGRKQRQQRGNGNYDEKAPSRLLCFLDSLGALSQNLLVIFFYERCSELAQGWNLSCKAEPDGLPFTSGRQFH